MTTGDWPIIGDTGIASNLPAGNLIAGEGLVVTSGGGVGWSTIEVDLPGNRDFKDLKDRIETIEERLCILRPNEELQKRFPALQEAYDHYKVIEKLVNDQSKIHE